MHFVEQFNNDSSAPGFNKLPDLNSHLGTDGGRMSAVLPLMAPAAPVVGGAMLAAVFFKWLTDADKRKLSEIRDKRQAIEGLLRSGLLEAFASFSGQLDQLQADFVHAEAALLQPVMLYAQAACRLPRLQQAVAERVLGQSRQMIRGAREDLHLLECAA